MIVAESSFHIGELYFLIPFLYSLEPGPEPESRLLVFTRDRAHRQFRADPVLVSAAESMGMKTLHLRSFDGWPSPIRSALKLLTRSTAATHRRLLSQARVCLAQVAGSCLAHAWHRSATSERSPLLIRFPHTSGPQYRSKEAIRSRQVPSYGRPGELVLVQDQRVKPFMEHVGFRAVLPIGYPQVSDRWLAHLASIDAAPSSKAVIFSYAPRDDVLPLDRWQLLHREAVAAIRGLDAGLPIYIKPHPGQTLSQLEQLAKQESWREVFLTDRNPMHLVQGASLCVSFLTSGIYNAVLAGVPAVNYFNAYDVYEASYGPAWQDYSAHGIPDARTPDELRHALDRALAGDLPRPALYTQARDHPRFSSWPELEAAARKCLALS